MKIIIGSDHGAYELKNSIKDYLSGKGHLLTDVGVNSADPVDYPDIAKNACSKFLAGGYDFGILLCGTGVGISISANKINGIRCALIYDIYSAKMTKCHNNPNFIALGGRAEYRDSVYDMLDVFILSQFEGGRHQNRIDKIMKLECS